MKDAFQAVGIAVVASWYKIVYNYLIVPISITIVLILLAFVDTGLYAAGIRFPASVLGMLILFLTLIGLSVVSRKSLSKVLKIINVPLDLPLREIGLCFTPAFVTLPLSPPISIAEAFTIGAVFLIGYLFWFAAVSYLILALRLIPFLKSVPERRDEPADQLDEELQPMESHFEVDTSHDPILRTPSPVAEPEIAAGSITNMSMNTAMFSAPSNTLFPPADATPSPAQELAKYLLLYQDAIIWSLFFLVGLIVYAFTGHSLFIDGPINVLAYMAAKQLKSPWNKVLHPILTASALTVFGIFLVSLAASGGNAAEFLPAIRSYRTGRTYNTLVGPQSVPLAGIWPGAGDVLASLLSVSIVSLALPMFNYRAGMRGNTTLLLICTTISAVACFFLYPLISFKVGISSTRALAMAARSATLALALPMLTSLGASEVTGSAVAILSGILGVLIGDKLFKWLRIRDDDYLLRGIVQGINSSAVATADMLTKFPRAGAIASLSFAIYGTQLVILSAIPAISGVVRQMVDLPAAVS
ncbi:hypothetical protein CANCADRAFT_3190 [Tortispora caseinolytica NRRL Y-17796]|uniref:LrgB-like protein n=1 Tax=Tortispora caseinolytica NRRL Y-17796 TaxID=767744 RepID=A0A1E4T9Y1_9ASCO|nr:hypothetical protein CANCADRAFT_3190 [Tortispora caseinolytica NRRL Y-17796]